MIDLYDNGHVRLLGSTLRSKDLESVFLNVMDGRWREDILDHPTMTLEIKAPLFVKMSMQGHFKVLDVSSGDPEFWVPDLSYVESGTHEDDKEIADYIAHAVESLKVSMAGLVMDKCNPHVAQLLTPLCVYNTFIATGTLREWIQWSKRKMPVIALPAKKAVTDFIQAEWNNIDKLRDFHVKERKAQSEKDADRNERG